MSTASELLARLAAKVEAGEGRFGQVGGADVEDELAGLQAAGTAEAVDGLLRQMCRPESTCDVRHGILDALVGISSPAAIDAIGAYEDWATARGTHLRPVSPGYQPLETTDRAGRHWALFRASGWGPGEHWWITWRDGEQPWAPAAHLGRLDSAEVALEAFAVRGRAALTEVSAAVDDAQVLDRLLLAVDEPSDNLFGIPEPDREPEPVPWLHEPPSPTVVAIRQAVFTYDYATQDSRKPLLVEAALNTQRLRGYPGAILACDRAVDWWANVSMGRIDCDGKDRASMPVSEWSGPLSAFGREVLLERRQGRWVVTGTGMEWFS